MRGEIKVAATSDVPVLITGEQGVGKELVAKLIHDSSARSGNKFGIINCPATPSELAESTWFGYEPGSFTGALNRGRRGIIGVSDKGTVFFDEIGDLDLKLQNKLLRFLQEGELSIIGGTDIQKVDVRVIAATNKDLEKSVHSSLFRADLYDRFNVYSIYIPPLRERKEDIPELVMHFASKYAGNGSNPIVSEGAIGFLMEKPIYGNVRELENCIRVGMVRLDSESGDGRLKILEERHIHSYRFRNSCKSDLTSDVGEPLDHMVNEEVSEGLSLIRKIFKANPDIKRINRMLEELEKEVLLDALNSTKFNRGKAAKLLDMDYMAFLYKVRKYKL